MPSKRGAGKKTIASPKGKVKTRLKAGPKLGAGAQGPKLAKGAKLHPKVKARLSKFKAAAMAAHPRLAKHVK